MNTNIEMVKNIESSDVTTHAGVFHADEVFAVAIIAARKEQIKVCRVNRIMEGVALGGAILVDIGGGCFDHHQRGFNSTREDGSLYASAGLVWREFYHQLTSCKEVANEVDNSLLKGIDLWDNGKLIPGEIMTISGMIAGFNPQWNEPQNASDEAFLRAVEFASVVLKNTIARAEAIHKAQVIVKEAESKAFEGIMLLEQFVPWQEHVDFTSVKFVVFPSRGGWNLQAVPKFFGSKENIQDLPAEWAGLESTELAAACGVEDATFCHRGRFIAGAASKEGAVKMAKLAIGNR